MRPTLNDLAEDVRAELAPLLAARARDARDLYLACKTAHWNVRGPCFLQLHKLFDKVAMAALGIQDELAELARSLGGPVDASAQSGQLPAMPVLETGDTCEAYVVRVAEAVGLCLKLIRAGAGLAMELDDLVTSDRLTRSASELQHLLYLVESHRR